MRPEQQEAVTKTMAYFKSFKKENPNKTPHFLWNAKMRFGKTFTSYQLAKKMGWKKLLVLTFKPAVEDAWREDLLSHVDFEGWQYISKNENNDNEDIAMSIESSRNQPLICFGSFQDYLGPQRYNQCIQTFIERWKGKHPLPHDFFYTFNDVSGENLNWLIKPWIFDYG